MKSMILATDRFPEERDFDCTFNLDQYSDEPKPGANWLRASERDMARMGFLEEVLLPYTGQTYAFVLNGVLTPDGPHISHEAFTKLNTDLMKARDAARANAPDAATLLADAMTRHNQAVADYRLEEAAKEEERRRMISLPTDRLPTAEGFDEVIDLDIQHDPDETLSRLEDDVNTMPYRSYAITRDGVTAPWNWLFSKEQVSNLLGKLTKARELIDNKDPNGPLQLVEAITVYNQAAAEPKPYPAGLLAGSAKNVKFHSLDETRAAYWARQAQPPL